MLIAVSFGDLAAFLVPFVLLAVFWAFLRERLRNDQNPQSQMLEKLEEIQQEPVRLRCSIESRP